MARRPLHVERMRLALPQARSKHTLTALQSTKGQGCVESSEQVLLTAGMGAAPSTTAAVPAVSPTTTASAAPIKTSAAHYIFTLYVAVEIKHELVV